MNEVFKLRTTAYCNLGILHNFFLDPVHGAYNDTESVWYSGTKIRKKRPS